uniref:MFS domain-containing protein n=1 Tax=Schistosoma mansoni TaxID=6183 RepID=A0A5K4F202_SCHMA
MFVRCFHIVTEIMQGDGTIAGCFSVLGGYLIHLSYGYLYSLTNMVPYIMGYLITFIDPHICVQTSVWFSAVTFAVYGIFMPLGGFLSRKIGYRPVLALSCLFLRLIKTTQIDCKISGGVLLSYFTIQKTYVGVILTYSFLFGTGVGLGFSVTLAVAATWFPEHRGLVVGLVVSGYGMGSLVFSPIQTFLINPNNVPVNNVTRQFDDPEILNRLPHVFLVIGVILSVTQIIGLILLRSKPKWNCEDDKIEILDDSGSSDCEIMDDEVKFSNCSNAVDITPSRLFRHIDFYLLWLIELCNSIPLTLLTSSYKLFGQSFISDDKYLTIIVTMTAVFNASGRILWGTIVDQFSYKSDGWIDSENTLLYLGYWRFSFFKQCINSGSSSHRVDVRMHKHGYQLRDNSMCTGHRMPFVCLCPHIYQFREPIHCPVYYMWICEPSSFSSCLMD